MGLDYEQVGRRIAELRKRRGISQLTLSELVDKSPTYISYIETGLKRMSLDTFVSLANALQCSADILLLDYIENTLVVSNHEFADILSDCNSYEVRVLLEVAGAAKEAMRESRRLLQDRK